MTRAYNFGAGPAGMPTEVLEEARAELLDYRGSGMSIMECSHRGKEYSAVHEEALANVRQLMELDEDHEVLFLQGGASAQFAMVPMNLRAKGQVADYANSGSWAVKAIKEAQVTGEVHVAADTSKARPTCVPTPPDLDLLPDAAYVHITTNETISGAQWKTLPDTDAPLVADMSSDILSRTMDFNRFGLIYAGAQKNLGPSGLALVIIRKDLADRAGDDVPLMFRYRTHLKADSLYNTPPTFGIYMVALVTRWIIREGGLARMDERNRGKAQRLYDVIDASEFYSGMAHPAHRSDMNVTLRLPAEELEDHFIKEATQKGMKGLKGHRSVGGVRASIYNACPSEAIDALIAFMQEFERKNG